MESPLHIQKKALWQDVRGLAEDAIRKGAEIGIETQSGMLGDALHGVGITTRQSFASMFARTQDEAVASVLNGSIYAGKRAGMSRRIWNNEALLGGQIEQLIASAVAQGRSATQLARDLEAFVKPDAMMPDNWNDIYEGLPFAFHVDYNAKRLAVSALNHSYFQGAILAGRENPYAEFLHWELSRSHEIYDVCDTYMEHDEGLGKGNFALDNAPLPHPFCKCTWYLDSSKSLEEIGQELGEWLAGAENPKLERAFGEWKQQDVKQLWQGYRIAQPGESSPLEQPAPELVAKVQETVDRVIADFPELKEHLETIEFVPEPGIGATRTDGKVIRFDNSIFHDAKRLQKVFDESVEQGYTVHASNPMFIVAHECGHVLENLAIMRQAGIERITASNRASFEKLKKEIGITYFLHMGFTDESVSEIWSKTYGEMGKRARAGTSELIAQAVANFFFSEQACPLSEKIVQYLKELLRGDS